MATAAWIKDMLEKRGVAYEELHHRVAFTAQEVAQSEHISGDHLAKVVVIIADGRPVELILPASRRVVLDRVEKLLGADAIRLASEAEMERIFTDCETGAIPPLRHWKDVTVLMDASMSNARDLVFQAATHEDAIRLNFHDWLALVKPRVEFFAEPEHASSPATFADRGDVGTERSGRRAKTLAHESKRESGQPGGGQGRIEVVGHSGVYPGSGPYPERGADVRTPGEFVHGQRDEEGREVEGGSGLIYLDEGILLGGEALPRSSPTQARSNLPRGTLEREEIPRPRGD
jgi:Ala-tRNA(Pro) deacylase